MKKKKSELTWDECAEAFLRRKFLPRAVGQSFLVEQFRKAAERAGVPMPSSKQGWGSFICKMKNAGVVRRAGFGIDSHASPKSMWRAA